MDTRVDLPTITNSCQSYFHGPWHTACANVGIGLPSNACPPTGCSWSELSGQGLSRIGSTRRR